MLPALAFLVMTNPTQQPGDRPAPNPRATRSVVLARNGLIATSQPLASAAGLRVLQNGGNAIDAAVTAAAVLSIVEPTMNGPGGDLFAIVYSAKDKKLYGLNASGRAPAAATPEEFARRGLKEVPGRGELAVSVPGVVDGWARLLERHGTIPFARALAPAIEYARDGFAVSEIIAHQWTGAEEALRRDPLAHLYLPADRAPKPGDIFRNPKLAATYETLAREGAAAFYKGTIAQQIAADMKRRGGLITEQDLAAHRADWVDPIATSYRGYDVYELPPNTQGCVALEMLNILEGFDIGSLGHNSAALLHLLAESKRIAFADRDAFLADPGFVPPDVMKMLLSKSYAARRRAEIDLERSAREYAPGRVAGTSSQDEDGAMRGSGDTIYLTAADREGNVISLIQSLYDNFGAAIVAGDTGIVLHNRGSLFTLRDGHPNRIGPGKRPMHTLVPAMVLKDGRPWLSFGVMGGDMQPQGHVQVLLNLIDFGMNVQEAGEAARVRHTARGLAVEAGIDPAARYGLGRRGHRVIDSPGSFGGFQGILIDPRTGVLMGGSDPRKDGLAIGH
jgi:gamma-glutamyltranspeptidase/glutathione hydrolase